jgi:small-conductance mechanosensitive channel
LLNIDPTGFNFFKNGLRVIIYLIAAIVLFYIIPPLNQFAQTLTVGATVIAAVAAFASQHALANVVGGIFIVIFKPFRVGDFIKVGTLTLHYDIP